MYSIEKSVKILQWLTTYTLVMLLLAISTHADFQVDGYYSC